MIEQLKDGRDKPYYWVKIGKQSFDRVTSLSFSKGIINLSYVIRDDELGPIFVTAEIPLKGRVIQLGQNPIN